MPPVWRDRSDNSIPWLKDESLLDADSLPDPDVIAEDLRSALEQIEQIVGDLRTRRA